MNKETKFLDIVKFGIDQIGGKSSASKLRSMFNSDFLIHGDDPEHMELNMTFNQYVGQNHFALICEQDSYVEIIDFDLLPVQNSSLIDISEGKNEEYLANFKIQLIPKRMCFGLLKAPTYHLYLEATKFLDKIYPQDQVRNMDFAIATNKVIETYRQLLLSVDKLKLYYLIKDGRYFLATLYPFKGKNEVGSYFSFSISII